ncbi:MAG TPA: cytochrome c oxidase accessory protein CcoG [Burkholderiales bacterium]|jgi:cytochrome c oxidase accessory protein FixG|nr:cytochrome c oxidase accessory protein CcoG [Burkholderiales bacterium]
MDASPRPRLASATQPVEQVLYEIRRKIYPRAVTGKFAAWRWFFVWATQLVFYGLPWLEWNGRQAVLFDLVNRKFYIFGLVFWPQDVIYLAVLLIISAYSLFLFTAVAGRLWCGYACPQTVYTEIFMWIERAIEGDRLQRMKLDRSPLSPRKIGLKAAKHGAWIAVALWTGFTFVGYFTPITTLRDEVLGFATGPWETFWIAFYGFATYGNAGWMREQVCKYMCPYARFQSVMFDNDTLIISYDRSRGEPRGARARNVDYKAKGLGDCVDCGICVQVCPTGIDIRDGLQYECIGCAACIDGCDQVMDKMGYPRGLIRYATESGLRNRYSVAQMLRRVFRPRVLIYTAVLWVIIGLAAFSLVHRTPIKVDVIRDRVTTARPDDPVVENVYRLQIMNASETPRSVRITVSGLEGLRLESERQPIDIGPATQRLVAVRLSVDRAHVGPGSNTVVFTVATEADPAENIVIEEKAAFVVP